jgi:hypothetical protein
MSEIGVVDDLADADECCYTRPADPHSFNDPQPPARVYNWQDYVGIDGMVLVCVPHGWPGWGEVYGHLDDDTTGVVRCQAFDWEASS